MPEGPTAIAEPLPRVMLVDDEESLRRLVAMMLDDLPIEFVGCADVAQARAELLARPVALLITDWMMPGESGLDLLRWLHAHPQARGAARLVVFSAGLDDVVLAQMDGLDVWRLLSKPVSLQAMTQCVGDALGWNADDDEATSCATNATPQDSAEARAIRQLFAGNAALFQALKADCVAQMAADMATGDAAIRQRDGAALRRLAHNLKSVMRTLGREADAQLGQALEDAAAQRDWTLALRLWPSLRQACQLLRGG